jgi:hypothetical protein
MEEVIIDSPINIETPFLEKILIGFSQIDRGSPVLYSDTVERIINRGLNELEIPKIASIACLLNKATNVHKGGFGFFEAMEKHVHQEMYEGRISFQQLT